MRLAKPSLINLLMEEGEEDTAVLLAASDLPDDLDSDRDAVALRALGLDEEDLLALLPAVAGTGLPSRNAAALDRTISQRWADLVADWTRKR